MKPNRQRPTEPARPLAIDRVLPNAADAERAVIGACLLNPTEVMPLIMTMVEPEYFYLAGHRVIFQEMIHLMDALQSCDPVTLQQRLHDRDLLEEVGGAAYLAELVSMVPTTAHAEHYARIVIDKYVARQAIEVAHEGITNGFDNPALADWLPGFQQRVLDLGARNRVESVAAPEFVRGSMDRIERWHANPGQIIGIPTGFRDLDRILGGMQDGNMIVIAARPRVGKTSLAMNIVENVACGQNPLGVGVFSMEMTTDELSDRLITSMARVSLRRIQAGGARDQDFNQLTESAARLARANIHIDDTAAQRISQIRARARRMKLQHGIRLAVIDYLQLAHPSQRTKGQSREQEVSDISAGCKAMAKELKIPVIVLSQLNRKVEERQGGRPRLSDLRESGSIEQDADVVGFLDRPEVNIEDEDERQAERGKATLIIAKQRNGPTGDVELTFRDEYMRFENRARIEEEDQPTTQGEL